MGKLLRGFDSLEPVLKKLYESENIFARVARHTRVLNNTSFTTSRDI
jgi:hypothetical protein